EEQESSAEIFESIFGAIDARTMDDLPDRSISDGRALTDADSGEPVAVVTQNFLIQNAGISAGDVMRFHLVVDGEPLEDVFEFTIVGIEEASFIEVGFDNAIYA